MRHNTIGSFVALTSVVTLLACKDTTASSSESSLSAGPPSTLAFDKLPDGCKHVKGEVSLTGVPAPNDPFGRIVGPSKGGLKGAATSVITSVGPGSTPGTLEATSFDTWVDGPTDILNSTSTAIYTPIPGEFDFTVDVTSTITGGTGKYDGALGTIHLTGVVHDLLPPNNGPGTTYYDLKYDGTVGSGCT